MGLVLLLFGLLRALVCRHLPAPLTLNQEPRTVLSGQIGSRMLPLSARNQDSNGPARLLAPGLSCHFIGGWIGAGHGKQVGPKASSYTS
jgi:hypothetical protein